jgi:hypothetical protein
MGILEILAKPMDIAPGRAKHEGKMRRAQLRDQEAVSTINEGKAIFQKRTMDSRVSQEKSAAGIAETKADVMDQTRDAAVTSIRAAADMQEKKSMQYTMQLQAEMEALTTQNDARKQITRQAREEFERQSEVFEMEDLHSALVDSNVVTWDENKEWFMNNARHFQGKTMAERQKWMEDRGFGFGYEGDKTDRSLSQLEKRITYSKEQLQKFQLIDYESEYKYQLEMLKGQTSLISKADVTGVGNAYMTYRMVSGLPDVSPEVVKQFQQHYLNAVRAGNAEMNATNMTMLHTSIDSYFDIKGRAKQFIDAGGVVTPDETMSTFYDIVERFAIQPNGSIDYKKGARTASGMYQIDISEDGVMSANRLSDLAISFRMNMIKDAGATLAGDQKWQDYLAWHRALTEKEREAYEMKEYEIQGSDEIVN